MCEKADTMHRFQHFICIFNLAYFMKKKIHSWKTFYRYLDSIIQMSEAHLTKNTDPTLKYDGGKWACISFVRSIFKRNIGWKYCKKTCHCTEELKLGDCYNDHKHKVKLTFLWLDSKRWPTMTQSNIQSDPVLKPINKAVLSDRFVSCALIIY